MTDFKTIAIDNIVRRKDARPTDDNKLMELEDSVRRLGLLNPLTVRAISGGEFEVLAGGHRFAACHAAGFHEIACHVVDLDENHAKLAMIDENLCRAELGNAERVQQIAERKAIYLKLHPETAQHVAGGKARQETASANLSFAANTASATGRSERTIQRDAERGEKIAPEAISEIRGTRLDTGAYLDELKRLPREQQPEKVRQDLAEPLRAREPRQEGGRPTERPAALTNSDAVRRFLDVTAELAKVDFQAVALGFTPPQRAVLLRSCRHFLPLFEMLDEALRGENDG